MSDKTPGVPVEQAIQSALDALGPKAIDVETAPQHLRALADAYDEVERARVVYDRRAEAAKSAKQGLEHATAHLIDMVRELTHPQPLPLFDVAQAEADRVAMTGAQP